MIYDVLIVGAGVTGAAVAYELSRYDLKLCVCERFNDVGNGATKANSAVLHAGFDCPPDTIKARLNVLGGKMAKEICQKLDIERREMPSLVLAFDDEDKDTLQILYKRGVDNGIEGMKILSREEALALEKNINPEIVGALYAPSAIVNPWELALGMAEISAVNGTEYHLSTKVTAIEKEDGIFTVTTDSGVFKARYVVNAAGAYSADVAALVGCNRFKQTNRCGQYYVLDKSQCSIVNSVIFQCPTKRGKGVLVVPTVHGNLLVGPDSFTVEDGDSVATDKLGLDNIKASGLKSVPGINFREIIHEYAGVRPNCDVDDFIIEEAPECKGFINLAGIQSPGLTAAPAIALECRKLLENSGLAFNKKDSFIDERHRVKFKELSDSEKVALIKKNPLYGRIICRCETVTEGEIVDAIRRPIVPTTIDAIKRRCNAGLGRCQGGFCGPRVHEILARELSLDPKDILMDEQGSYIITSKVKEAHL